MKPKLHIAADHVLALGNLEPLNPEAEASVRAVCDQRFRVIAARVIAVFPQSRIEQLLRRIPVLGRFITKLFADRDASDRAWATAQVRIDHVTVGDRTCPLGEFDARVVADAGTEISVSVINRGDRPVVAHVLIEGITE